MRATTLIKHKAMEVLRVPCLSDNYGWLVRCTATGATASVDTPEAKPLLGAAAERDWKLTHILNTHHHWDHVGGNEEMVAATGCRVVGFVGDAGRIPSIAEKVSEGDVVRVGDLEATVIHTPGHTTGHVSYHFRDSGVVFTGDTLFSMGCGRLFEGNPPMMWESLSKLAVLPPDTAVYCAHEYTEANGRFALSVDPENAALLQRVAEVKSLRAADQATVPTSIGVELATNPFLRAADSAVRAKQSMQASTDVEVFARIRHLKDNF